MRRSVVPEQKYTSFWLNVDSTVVVQDRAWIRPLSVFYPDWKKLMRCIKMTRGSDSLFSMLLNRPSQ